jgi:hypothetical protein
MANPEHLAILKQEVEQWNKWRRDHVELLPNLRNADLQGARRVVITLLRHEVGYGAVKSELALRVRIHFPPTRSLSQ